MHQYFKTNTPWKQSKELRWGAGRRMKQAIDVFMSALLIHKLITFTGKHIKNQLREKCPEYTIQKNYVNLETKIKSDS